MGTVRVSAFGRKRCVGAALRELRMPPNTRIAALFRGKSCCTSGSTDTGRTIFCASRHEHDLPILGKLFSQGAGRDARRALLRRLYPAIDARLSDISQLYGLNLQDDVDDSGAAASSSIQLIGGEPGDRRRVEWDGLTGPSPKWTAIKSAK